jgi:imidazolonepropionase-like amidohydrolase
MTRDRWPPGGLNVIDAAGSTVVPSLVDAHGVIREGGPGDLVLVHGDPLSDPTALWRAWHVSWATR